MDFKTEVKLTIYRMITQNALIPDAEAVSAKLDVPEENIREMFQELAANRLLVLKPGDATRIRMAPPFSGIPTSFRVEVGDKPYYANCVWDAFGIIAALQLGGIIFASDGYTDEPLILEVRDNQPTNSSFMAHFAIPAAHWWDDIIHT